jgi:Concanavalin A-like lectin/glucanases superfamily
VGGQIINYNGPPSRYLPDVHSPGVLQVGEKVDSRNGPIGSIAGKAFVGRDSRGADVSAGIVASDSLGSMQPRVVVYVYNNSENIAALYVDGHRIAEASAPTKVAVTSRKVIGKHGIFDQWYFSGDLAELAIYNAALGQNEIQNLSQQLMDRYDIANTGKIQL